MSRAKLLLFTLAIGILFSCRCFGFDDWQPITPEELKMTADPAHPGDAIILYHEETANDLTRHRYVYKRVKIFTEKGKRYADVDIPFDASFIGITDIRARTIAPDGSITPFNGKAFTTTKVKGHGVKYQAKTFAMPDVQVGSIIEWKYTEYWDEYLFAPHWTVQDNLFQKRAKFSFIPFIKAGYYIKDNRGDIKDRVYYTLVGLPDKTTIKTTTDDRMELELKDIPAFEEEEFSPPAAVLKWRVNFYYGTDQMNKPQEFWKHEGKFWTKEAEKFMQSGAASNSVSQIVGPSDTAEQKARKIYAFVQKIKNLNYTSREGNLEEQLVKESKEKRTLDDLLKRQEGYRDEITRLFVAMARAAKLPAYLMRVADRDEIFFQPSIPNPNQLTSEIAVLNIDGKEIFLDPGTPLCPFGHLAWQHTSSQGIRQTTDGSTALAATPAAKYKDAVSKHVGRLNLNEDGSVKGKVGIAWAGEEALVHRLSGLKTDAAGKTKDLEDELRAILPQGSMVKLDTSNGWDDAEAQLTANFSVEIPSYASTTGKRLMVPRDLFQTRSSQPFSHGDRKNPVYFIYPYYAMDETTINFPQNFRVENVPDIQPVRTDYSLYTVKHTSTGNSVTFSRDFAMAGIGFQPKDYPELRKFFSAVTAGDSEPLVLTVAK